MTGALRHERPQIGWRSAPRPETIGRKLSDLLNAYFPESYTDARQHFSTAAATLGWSVAEHPLHDGRGDLSVSVASSSLSPDKKTLLLTTGLHGVEGYLGSAVQLAVLEVIASGELSIPPDCRIVMAHSLNPYGFANDRRTDEDNIDLNRNFLLPGENFEGCPPGYEQIDHLLNPTNASGKLECFIPRMLLRALTTGFPEVKAAIACGQYRHPRGLFYGGSGISAIQELVRTQLDTWIPPASPAAMLIDVHTGLGRHGQSTLLTGLNAAELATSPLSRGFQSEEISSMDPSSVAYPARGTFTAWVTATQHAKSFHAWGLEFGTHSGLRVLTALREENRQHFYGDPSSPAYLRAKAELRECFCPANPEWRQRVVQGSIEVITRALETLHEA